MWLKVGLDHDGKLKGVIGHGGLVFLYTSISGARPSIDLSFERGVPVEMIEEQSEGFGELREVKRYLFFQQETSQKKKMHIKVSDKERLEHFSIRRQALPLLSAHNSRVSRGAKQ